MLTSQRFQDRLHYVSGPPNGPTLVLFHGVLRRWQSYLALIPTLAARYHVVALDHRGHGESAPAADGSYLVADYVADAVEFVRSLAAPVLLFGHSLGGMVAAGVAAALGGQVQGAILEDPPFSTMGRRIDETPLLSQFTGLSRLCGSPDDIPTLVQKVGEIRVTDPRTNVSMLYRDMRDPVSVRFAASNLRKVDRPVLEPVLDGRWLEGFATRDVLARIECPVLLLQADARMGAMLSNDEVAVALSALRDGTVQPFPGVGHGIHTARPMEVLTAVFSFFETMEQATC